MPFVLDASVTASWAFPDEHHPAAIRAGDLLESSLDSAVVPALWWYEVRNVLLVNERRGRIALARTAIFLEQIAQLSIRIEHDLDSGFTLDLARSYNLTVYDASYLALAIRGHAPLATLDKALQLAAISAGISILV